MSESNQLDPNQLTPRQAGIHFQEMVANRMQKFSEDHLKAWTQVSILNPELCARMREGQSGIGGGQSLASALMVRKSISLPNEGNIEALGLPRDASFEEFRCADSANAGASPRNAAAIFEALVGLQVQNGVSLETARDAARERYPKLFAEMNAGGAPDEAGGNNGSAPDAGSFIDRVRGVLIGKGALAPDASNDEVLPAILKLNFRAAS